MRRLAKVTKNSFCVMHGSKVEIVYKAPEQTGEIT